MTASFATWLGASGEAVELASSDDRKWFAGHPGERFRYRQAYVGELPDEAWRVPGLEGVRLERMVEVEQLIPGARIRRPYVVLIQGVC